MYRSGVNEFTNTPKDELTHEALSSDSIPLLVMRDRETRLYSVHIVPMKGAVVVWTAQQVARDLERLGHQWKTGDPLLSGRSSHSPGECSHDSQAFCC